MKVRFLEAAQHELDEAVEYYNAEVPKLGHAFLMETLAALERIRQFPNGWHPLSQNTRRCRLLRFPYGVVYAAAANEITVIALAHLHRKPGYWRQRPVK
ncbi:plasmid stabilization system protein [mine drainage metagenome]|uniref:Plasmid stabilization system protein n=1 Tax=mine drainage metagenome TaxID=410659 RepID=A0A1J5QVU7_9ZZZZ